MTAIVVSMGSITTTTLHAAGRGLIRGPVMLHYNNNNNNDITSMALKSSEARAQKLNKTKSVIIFKSRGHTGIIISFKGPPTI